MVKYGIQTILINDYDEITLMLKHLYNKYITNNVFISGGIDPTNLSDYGSFKMENDTDLNLNPAESFLTMLGRDLVDNGFHIYTGFGAGVGNYVLSGVLQSKKNRLNGEVINDDIHISSMMSVTDVENKNRIRRKMIEQCSSSIIVFGYGDENSGTYQEYYIAKDRNKYIIPVKKTGFAAKEIYDELAKKEKQELLFLEKENEIIGYIGLWFLGDQCQITTIATDQKYQGQGYASQLMEYTLEKSEALHYQNVNLEVRVSNVKAIALYEKFGFKNVAIRKRYYSN